MLVYKQLVNSVVVLLFVVILIFPFSGAMADAADGYVDASEITMDVISQGSPEGIVREKEDKYFNLARLAGDPDSPMHDHAKHKHHDHSKHKHHDHAKHKHHDHAKHKHHEKREHEKHRAKHERARHHEKREHEKHRAKHERARHREKREHEKHRDKHERARHDHGKHDRDGHKH